MSDSHNEQDGELKLEDRNQEDSLKGDEFDLDQNEDQHQQNDHYLPNSAEIEGIHENNGYEYQNSNVHDHIDEHIMLNMNDDHDGYAQNELLNGYEAKDEGHQSAFANLEADIALDGNDHSNGEHKQNGHESNHHHHHHHHHHENDYFEDDLGNCHGYAKEEDQNEGDKLYLRDEGEGQSDDEKDEEFDELRVKTEHHPGDHADQQGNGEKKKKKKRKEKTGGKDFRFSKFANCHMCKRKNKYVYGCYKNWVPTSCNKFFCVDCLLNGLKENIILTVQKEDTWKCPYNRNTCLCRHCLNKKEDFKVPLIEDPDEISRLFGEQPSKKAKKNDSTENSEDIAQTRAQMKLKIKKLADFNGQLIQKMSKLQAQLSKEEIIFYNKLIHDNLLVLDNLVSCLTEADKIKEEEQVVQSKFHYH